MTKTPDPADKAFDNTVKYFGDKNPGAMNYSVKDKEQMLSLYDFPTVYWQ
jgi:hypothetical protein